MMRHRRDEDAPVTAAGPIPAADLAEQHQPTDPIEAAETATPPTTPPTEADPADAADQAETIALDDELRAD